MRLRHSVLLLGQLPGIRTEGVVGGVGARVLGGADLPVRARRVGLGGWAGAGLARGGHVCTSPLVGTGLVRVAHLMSLWSGRGAWGVQLAGGLQGARP